MNRCRRDESLKTRCKDFHDNADRKCMRIKEIGISEFRAKMYRLLRAAQRTRTTIRITRFGRPIAEIVPIPTPRKRNWIGSLRGKIEILGDIVSPATGLYRWGSASSYSVSGSPLIQEIGLACAQLKPESRDVMPFECGNGAARTSLNKIAASVRIPGRAG